MRGIAAGILTLIMLQALGTGKGPEQGGKLLVWFTEGLQHALSPGVAAIPTRKPPKKAPAAKPAPSTSSAPPLAGGISLPRNPQLGTVTV